jgi:hypothetical protein
MKTAVEWLVEKFMTENTTKEGWHEIFEQAKEMEDDQKKELVVATYTYLKMKDCHLPYGMEYLNKISELDDEAEQYYNETFKKK